MQGHVENWLQPLGTEWGAEQFSLRVKRLNGTDLLYPGWETSGLLHLGLGPETPRSGGVSLHHKARCTSLGVV